MAFWAWLVGACLVMMGVLTTSESYAVHLPNFLINATWMAHLPIVMVGVCLVLSLWVSRRFAGWIAKFVLSIVLYGVAMFGIGVHTYGVVYRFYQYQPTAPITVQATAELLELSDNPYNPAIGEPYRQVVRLSELRPTTANAGTSPNPFYNPTADARLTQTSANLPSTMTVLATARPPSTNKITDPLAKLSELKVGDKVVLTLRLSPIVKDSRTDFKYHRWLTARHVHATGQIVSVDSQIGRADVVGLDKMLLKIQALRQQYRDVFYAKFATQDPAGQSATAITLSLLTGDRAFIDTPSKELYQYAGISHLLAISGTHVLFLAVVLANLLIFVINRIFPSVYYTFARWQVRFWVMASVALLYALFTGFDVPAMRTVLMLFVMGLARYLLLSWSGLRVLAVVGLMMAMFDPFVLWQAGFWLSFVAVAILINYENDNQHKGLKQEFIKLLKLQTYVFVAMLPISLMLFGKISLLGLVINLLAVGLFGFVIVPLNLLAGVVFWLVPALADGLWAGVSAIIYYLNQALSLIRLMVGDTWIVRPMSLALLLLFMLGVFLARGKLFAKRLSIVPFVAFLLGFVGVSSPHQALPNATSATTMTILKTNNPSLSAVLVQDWLIVALYPTNTNTPINDEKLSQELMTALGAVGQRTLSGVIVQNGDNKSRQALGRAVGRLSLELPIHELYWAGQGTRFGNVHTRTCQADITMTKDWGVMNVVTGWQTIKDETMHACNVFIAFHGEAAIYHDMDNGQVQTSTNVLIEHSTEQHLWGVYELLCPPQHKIRPDTVLMSSQSALSSKAYKNFGSQRLLFSNTLHNEQQRQQAKTKAKTLGVDF